GKANTDTPLNAVKHGENTAGIGFHIYIFKSLCAVPGFVDRFYFIHTVYAVCPYLLGFIVKSQEIIVAVIYEKLIGADFVNGSAVSRNLLYAAILKYIFQILEGNFLWSMGLAVLLLCHGGVDNADSQQN